MTNVRAVKTNPRASVTSQTVSTKASRSTLWRTLRQQPYRYPQSTNHSSVRRIRRRDYNRQRSTEWRQSDGKCEERRDRLMILNIRNELNCEARWKKCHGLGLHGCFWSGFTNLYWWCNSWWQQQDEFCQPTYWVMHPNELGGTSSCSKTMTQNTLPTQQRTWGKFSTGQVNYPIEHAFHLLVRLFLEVFPFKQMNVTAVKASQKKNASLVSMSCRLEARDMLPNIM